MVFIRVHRRISVAFLKHYNKFWLFDADIWPRGLGASCLKLNSADQLDELNHQSAMRKRRRLWPGLILAVMILANCKMLLNCYYHFKYDIEYIKLIRMANQTDGALRVKPSSKNYAPGSWQYLQQAARVNASRQTLESIGDVSSAEHWATSVMFLNCICASILAILSYQVLVCFNLIQPHDWYFLRVMLNEAEELDRCRGMMMTIVDQFKASSRLFCLNWAKQVERSIGKLDQVSSGAARPSPIRLGRLPRRSQLICEAKLQAHLNKRVDELAQDDQLMPLNRLPEMVNEMSLKFASMISRRTLIGGIFFTVVMVVLPICAGFVQIDSLMDVWMASDVLNLLITDSALVFFGSSMYQTIWTNQIHYMETVRSKLDQCQAENQKLFKAYRRAGKLLERDTIEQLAKILNENLLRGLIEYRVFARQFAPTKCSFTLIASIYPLLLLVDYFILRLTLPYVGSSVATICIVGRSVLVVILVDVVLVPICRMEHSAKRMYTRLASLLAHSIDLNVNMDKLVGHQVYSAHLVWLQRQIVDDQEKFMEQFSAQALDGDFVLCWSNLVQIHYFISMLLLSFSFKLQSWQNIFGSRLDDPLNLFSD